MRQKLLHENMARTRDELRNGLRHILDTFDQAGAHYAWRVVRKRYNVPDNDDHLIRVVAQASLESALINLRALSDFFRPDMDRDDIRAVEFPGYQTPGPFLLSEDITAINKRIAHITWHRETPYDGHYVRRNLGEAVDRMLHFLGFLRAQHLNFDDPELPAVLNLERRLQAVRKDALA